MPVPFVLADGGVSNCKAQLHDRDGECGLVVYSKPRYQPTPQFLPFLNSDYGNAINQDASAGGTPINVHDGIDNVYWTGSSIIGSSVTFNSTDRASDGTNSVRVNSPTVGDVWEFDKGSTQDLTSYSTLTLQINVNRRWTAGDSVSVYGYNSGQVGNKVFIEDYFDETSFDVWQSVTIPLEDMSISISTISALRFEMEAQSGQTPDFYMDEVQIQETGGPIEFRTSHSADRRYLAHSFVVTMVDNIAGTLASAGGMTPITYNQFLGTTVGNGLTLRSVYDGDIDFSGTISGVIDFMAVGFEITNRGTDGTNTFITLTANFKDPIILEGDPLDNYISMTVNDDLSGLVRFTAGLRGSYIDV
jgi:hypothetical protein